MHKIFCYGTLKRNYRNNRYLSGQEFLGEAKTVAGYILADLGLFPGLIEHTNDEVCGEVWQVNDKCLREIDRLESGLFERKSIKLQAPFDQDNIECYFYIGIGACRSPYLEVWTKK
jgi:gamma-glutamylcyclotransferase (GGCT)/AIG2-like uncharacterized protein YtfP